MAVALADADMRGMLEFLWEAGAVDNGEVFTEPVVESFRRLFPNDNLCALNIFSDLDPRSRPERRSILDFGSVGCEFQGDRGAEWTDEIDEICRLFVRDEEAIPPEPRFMLRPLRVSDVLTSREQRARKLWWYVERHFYEDAMWLWLPAPEEGVLRRIAVAAERRGGIGDREVRILELLTPYFVQLYQRAHARRVRPRTEGLTAREHEILALVREGKTNKEIAQTLWVSPKTVGKHLENAFEKLGVTNRTAAAARLFDVT
jgi:DNA-binding CsgD family transcriptional regulator